MSVHATAMNQGGPGQSLGGLLNPPAALPLVYGGLNTCQHSVDRSQVWENLSTPSTSPHGSCRTPGHFSDEEDWEVHTDDGFDDLRRSPCFRRTNVPRRQPLRPLPPGATTLVVRNIPAVYTKETLLREWLPDDTIDFLHLPCDIPKRKSLGCAFVNFVSPEAALCFQRRMHGSYTNRGKAKHMDVAAAEVQGLEATLAFVTHKRRPWTADLLPAMFEKQVRLSPEEVMERAGLQQALALPRRSRQRGRRGGGPNADLSKGHLIPTV